MARSIGYSSGIDGAYEKRKNHRMLLVEEPRVSYRHAGFDAVAFGLNRGSNHTAVRAVVGRDNDRFSAKEGIGLLFTCSECRIEVYMHYCRGIVI
jgi:hypothetical protein